MDGWRDDVVSSCGGFIDAPLVCWLDVSTVSTQIAGQIFCLEQIIVSLNSFLELRKTL